VCILKKQNNSKVSVGDNSSNKRTMAFEAKYPQLYFRIFLGKKQPRINYELTITNYELKCKKRGNQLRINNYELRIKMQKKGESITN